jgi:UrcA family protein
MTQISFLRHGSLISAVGALTVVLTALTVSSPARGKEGRPVVVTANPDVVTRSINYADLNLASLPGEVTLNRRVGSAVRSLCEEATGADVSFYGLSEADRLCRTSAWSQARPQIGAAVNRAREIASTGTSTIAAAGIRIALPH